MSDTDLKPLFTYLDEEFGKIHAKLSGHDQKLDDVFSAIDGLTKQVLTFQQEMTMPIMSMRVSRMDSWIQAASAKLGIPYAV